MKLVVYTSGENWNIGATSKCEKKAGNFEIPCPIAELISPTKQPNKSYTNFKG